MQQLKWIESYGGPFVFIGEKNYKKWSAGNNRELWQNGVAEPATDFMNPEDADYGSACAVEGYIGVVEMTHGKALVLGNEPAPTACLIKDDNAFILARWIYAADENTVGELLHALQLQQLNGWTLETTFEIDSASSFVFDAATTWETLIPGNDNFHELQIRPGNFKIQTLDFMPDEETHIVIHWFERMPESQ